MKYVLGTLATIFALVLLVIFVFNRGDSNTPADNKETVTKLVDYAKKNSEVTHTTIGPLVGEDQHREIRITVTAAERRLDVISGYSGTVISTQTFPNTTAAYEAFLSALGGQGFIAKKDSDVADQRSVCPSGRRYNYVLREGSSTVSELWSNNCNTTGTFNGRSGTVRELFQRQIPEYNKLVTGTQV